MTGEDLADLADCDAGELEWCEWANLVGYEEVIAMVIRRQRETPRPCRKHGCAMTGLVGRR
jgi:hypothetical protein